MKVEIKKRNQDSEEVLFSFFDFNDENGLYDTVEQKFAHIMWDKLIKKEFGYEYTYIEGYYDFIEAFGRYGFEGQGIYRKGKLILSSQGS